MPRKKLIKDVKTIVVKVGTSIITDNGIITRKKISRIAAGIDGLRKKGYNVILVSSGAIAAGASAVKKKRGALSIPEKQALSAIGQTALINEYRNAFKRRGYNIGQILLTEDDIKNRRRYLNARHTLNSLIEMGVIPIINENDTVVVKEIKFGDNDTLSAHISSLVDADLLILLSDVDGFYNDISDPEPVREISEITHDIIQKARGAGSVYGTGGMYTKILAAEIIIRFGEMMIIANGHIKNVLTRIMDGEEIGTIFAGSDKSLRNRKKWLALRKAAGFLTIDDGAVNALRDGKKSLLAPGILSVEGEFDMGDAVDINSSTGHLIGKGIVNYNYQELKMIKGKKTQEIKKILGSKYFDEVINRDDMIVY
jgi:glutamate 5-kinase